MPKIGYSANGFGKAMEADGGGRGLEDPQGPRDGLRRVPVATVLANGAGEMQAIPARGILTGCLTGLGKRVGPWLRESRLLTPSGRRGASSRNLGPALSPNSVHSRFPFPTSQITFL